MTEVKKVGVIDVHSPREEGEKEKTLERTSEDVNANANAKANAVTETEVKPAFVEPRDRDVCIDHEYHKGTMLLKDLIQAQVVLLQAKKKKKMMMMKKSSKNDGTDESITDEEARINALAAHITQLFLHGKNMVLSGLKDVPKPFLIGTGRFFEAAPTPASTSTSATNNSTSNTISWVELSSKQAQIYVTKLISDHWKVVQESNTPNFEKDNGTGIPVNSTNDNNNNTKSLVEAVTTFLQKNDTSSDNHNKAASKNSSNGETSNEQPLPSSAPRPCDVLFRPIQYEWEETAYEQHQSGNKHLLFLASQNIATDTNDTQKRVEAAFQLVTAQMEVLNGTELVRKTPRYVAQEIKDNQNSWRELEHEELLEFASVFTFEVYLEKQIHGVAFSMSSHISSSINTARANPSDIPVENPSLYDVLFGRGGMTNGHPGNRRFRDIISLHRPDYIRASKMDKPNVARRIVRAIREGSPPGRFLKKFEDGQWYDVGDRTAAEKTSQALRERSNAEKRQRSALREALRIRKEDLDGDIGKEGDATTGSNSGDALSSKRQKTGSSSTTSYVSGHLNYTNGIPLSLSMKETITKDEKGHDKPKKTKKAEEEPTEPLPPNAVDKEGNILVTDYDILCGRGGLTNHHKGNKRFRDIVQLHRPDYVRAPKIQKPSVARVIVRAIRNGDPPGRFLKKDETTGKWVDVGDKKAAEKTSQALREKTGEEKEQDKADRGPSMVQAAVPVLAPKVEVTMDEKAAHSDATLKGNHGGIDTVQV